MMENAKYGLQQSLKLTEEDKQQGYWTNLNIGASVFKPLFASFLGGMTEELNREFEQFKYSTSVMAVKFENERLYINMNPMNGDLEKQQQEHLRIVRSMYPQLNEQLQAILEESYFPFFKEVDQSLKQELTIDEAQTLAEDALVAYQKAFPRQLEVMLPHQQLHKDLESLYHQCTGDDDTTVIYDLLIGVPNKTLEMDRELRKLAQRVKDNDTLQKAFLYDAPEDLRDALSKSQEGRSFWIDFEQFLSNYGHRMIQNRDLTGKTWLENPAIPLSTIADYVESDEGVDERFQRAVETRKRKYNEVLQRIPEGERKETFKQYYQWALNASNIDDDHHFYMDEMLTAKVRFLLLHIGDFLVTHNVIENREDIFYLYFDELQEVLKHPENIFELIAERQAEHRENLQKEAPSSYGVPPKHAEDNIIAERATGSVAYSESSTDNSLKGLTGSKGKHTGTVKVLESEEEFGKFEKNDVLVTNITTPSWTVLFSRAGAIVTNVGGILSHPGINAREYQVPAVLGTKDATSRLKDGDVVTVDGTNGWVTLDEQA